MLQLPGIAPVFLPGQEPLPPGITEDDRAQIMQGQKYQQLMQTGMESCLAKTMMAGGFGTSTVDST